MTKFVALSFLLFVCESAYGENIRIRYGQIPSTIKTVSALQFHIAQKKGLFTREGIQLEMLPIEGGAAKMMAALDKGTVEITRTATHSRAPASGRF